MGCDSSTSSVTTCTRTYTDCSRHGNCCQCVNYHRGKNAIPGCFFTESGEKLHDRNLKTFFHDQGMKQD